MSNTNPKSEEFFEAYSIGICYASVCSNKTPEEVVEEMNVWHPSGVSSKWELSEDETFASGEPNPNQCADREDCKHYLLVC